MLFSSITFIFCFLPLVLCIYYIFPENNRNLILLTSSICFYAYSGVNFLILLVFSSLINYLLALQIHKYNHNKSKKKLILTLTLAFNISYLFIFKYSSFFINTINMIFKASFILPKIILPLGISFYTFQLMSYIIDVYRNECKVQKSFYKLLLYISMFPQLVSGPIVRYKTIENQIDDRVYTFDNFNLGLEKFIKGFFKKIAISDTLSKLSLIIYSMPTSEMSITLAWLGAITYTLQIYFDFSGYSDMAIGTAKMLGFNLSENFNHPYISKSASEFWRRWHISLGTWFKDYIYIPLGGNKVSTFKMCRNLAVVWLITGIWHGASFNFMLWGIYFGFFIIIEKLFLGTLLEKLPQIFQHIYLLVLVSVGWVLFSMPSIKSTFNYLSIMFGLGNYPIYNTTTNFYIKEYWLVLIVAITFSMPIISYMKKFFSNKFNCYAKPLTYGLVFILATIYLVNSTFNPFIYFKF